MEIQQKKSNNSFSSKVINTILLPVKLIDIIEKVFLFAITWVDVRVTHKSDYYNAGVFAIGILGISEMILLFQIIQNRILASAIIIILYANHIINHYSLDTEDVLKIIKLKKRNYVICVVAICWLLLIVNFYLFYKHAVTK